MFSIQELIYSYQFKLELEPVFSTIFDLHGNFFSLPVNHSGAIAAAQNKNVIGVSNVVSNSIAIAKLTSDNTVTASSKSTANVDPLAIGINNIDKINTHKGNDTILGIANGSSLGVALAAARSSPTLNNVDLESIATVKVVIDAVGISNLSKINTGQGNDSIIGLAKASGFGVAKARSQVLPAFGNKSSVNLSSESLAVVDTLAIGIDNQSKISTGQGHDIILGIASTYNISQAGATVFANNFAENIIGDLKIPDDIEISVSSGTSTAITETITNIFGIINYGVILTGTGNDTIVGVAKNESFSDALTISEAKSFAQDIVKIQVDSSSLAISRGNIVGIVNQGKINTGKGNDTIIGMALNATNAIANADADIVTFADNSNSQTHTNSIADTSELINIGIDNVSGLIETGKGNDSIIGYGTVGIQGGSIKTGKGNDSIIGYGDLVAIEDSKITLGKGNDYFKAALVNFDSSTEESWKRKESSSIKNTIVSGGRGNDIFEIESFEAKVSIDGGRGNDILKLSDNIENYTITQGSSEYQAFITQDTDSTLVVANVETFYFGDNDFAYSFNDLV